MVQYLQIDKHNTPHKQQQRQKSHDHIIDAEKAFDKIQHLFMIKTLSKVGVEGALPQHNKIHIRETYSQHYTQWAKNKSFPSKIRNKTKMSSFTTSIQHSIGSTSSRSDQTRKRNKSHPNWKGGSR